MFISSITFGLNQPLPERGVRTDVAAMLPRIMGIYGGEKKSFTKVKLYRTGKLNRTICRIGNFLESKTLRERQIAVVGCFFVCFVLFFVSLRWHWCGKCSPVFMLTFFMALERTMCYNSWSYYKPNQALNGGIIVSVTDSQETETLNDCTLNDPCQGHKADSFI